MYLTNGITVTVRSFHIHILHNNFTACLTIDCYKYNSLHCEVADTSLPLWTWTPMIS